MLASQIPLMRDDTLPKTLIAFTARFCDETACANLLRRWKYGGRGFVCRHCGGKRAWYLPSRRLDECRTCHRQMSLTAGTVMHGSRKPLRTWFLAIYLFVQSKQGISALELKRELSLGSYQTAWAWLHKLRAAMVRSNSEPLGPFVQIDEALVGGKGGPHKELVLVAAETGGRVRLAHVENNDTGTLKRFADGQIAADTRVVTDGHAGYNKTSLDKRSHERKVQTKAERRENDAVQSCHWTISLLKRWLLGTHAGAVGAKHLQACLLYTSDAADE